jgi:hypothetical protein
LKVTTDGGATWFNTGTLMLNPLVVASHPTDANIIHVGKLGKLERSGNAGSTWDFPPKIDDPNLVPLRLAVSTNNPNYWILGADTVLRSGTWTTSLYRSENGGLSWDPHYYFRDNAHTNVNDVIFDPRGSSQQVWIGGSRKPIDQFPDVVNRESPPRKGIWYSPDRGATWSYRSNFPTSNSTEQDVTAMAFSDGGSDLLFAATTRNESGTRKATLYQVNPDGGDITWAVTADLYAQIGVGVVRALKVNPQKPDTIIAATDKGFAISTNRGFDWELRNSGLGDVQTAYQVMFDKNDGTGNTVWIATYPTIFKSTNLGSSWSDNEGIFDFLSTAAFAIKNTTGQGVSSLYSGIARYSSGTWDKTPRSVGMKQFSGYDVAMNTTNTLYANAVGDSAGVAVIYVRTDGADGWRQVFTSVPGSSSTPMYVVATDPKANSQRVYAGGKFRVGSSYYNFIRSTNLGVNWDGARNIGGNNDVPVRALAIDASSGTSYSTVLYAGLGADGGTGLGIRKSVDGGLNWGTARLNGYEIISIVVASSNVIYMGTPSLLWRSDDALNNNPTVLSGTFGAKSMVKHPSYASTGYLWLISADGQKIYKTTNSGSDWTEVNTSAIAKPLNELAVEPSSTTTIYVATQKGVYSINPAPEPPSNISYSGSSGQHPTITWNASPELDLPSGGKYKVYRTLRSCGYIGNKIVCDEWGSTVDLTPTAISSTSYTDNTWTIVTPTPFIEFQQARYDVKVVDLANNYSEPASVYIYVGGDNPSKTAIRDDISDEPNKPAKFDLSANYPNPFNPVTLITYALPEDVHVLIKVFDVLGREVATLVNGFEKAGYKEVSFDASNLPSGTYFYKIIAGKFSEVKKMMLLK